MELGAEEQHVVEFMRASIDFGHLGGIGGGGGGGRSEVGAGRRGSANGSSARWASEQQSALRESALEFDFPSTREVRCPLIGTDWASPLIGTMPPLNSIALP